MSSHIQNMLHTVLGDGARSTKFDVGMQFTSGDAPNNDNVAVSVKTTSFPGKTHTPIDFKYRGRSIPVRGSTKYSQTWECTFYLDESHSLKRAFELWIEALDETVNYGMEDETNGLSSLQNRHYSDTFHKDINLYQLSFDETEQTSKYTLHNAYPIGISTTNVSYEGDGKVSEFTVTFAYTHYLHEILRGNDGNFVDSMLTTATEISTSLSTSISSFVSDSVGNSTNLLNDLVDNNTNTSTTTLDNTTLQFNTGGLAFDDMPDYLSQTA